MRLQLAAQLAAQPGAVQRRLVQVQVQVQVQQVQPAGHANQA
jgi:hypothetical protein